jgi:hypothetical protein
MSIASTLIAIAILVHPAIVVAPDGDVAWTPDAARVAPVPLMDVLSMPGDLPAANVVSPAPVPPKPGGWPAGTWPPLRWDASDAALDWCEWALGGARPRWATGVKP